ncbi:MAG: bifunctional pyr operon transcriptional regulator/uracil phosphoribosyltransferase PyrR [Hydrogenophaga sp.]|jgi:pyrimidine operon attenuation protein/uracil phosphoribosyltransferase|uniref:bifunctional pyr operon transcriptional regulator/uracil phosphoribosyltransferase PyrR n=1 Tax=Hydrogenophaga sp. TaxID=1904254 RepID=UPI0026300554|nr:bifunctional pyr operon transcriptional regulator/uracil phosphoribosyltransferase PyrR [Hydrogenophaga sp.]MDD3786727.1 bifunctional pyr operon transcriptional regulator/uracil phosphoribosyltransferase PyrR [Hydrogenophaga sp.]
MTTQPDIEHPLQSMAARLRELLAARGIGDPCMVGIHTGGVWVARRLHELLGLGEPLGTLDISFYRDDFSRIGVHPQVKPSNLPFDVEGRHIILVDDVLYTGRTIRAALNEIFDYGRPASVTLAVLVERGGRELPIQADVAGLQMDLETDQQVKLSGPEDLTLTVQSHAE